jgi:hypothetical protein
MKSYWGQWDIEEIRSLYGIEKEDDDEYLCSDEVDENLTYYEKNKCSCRQGCSYCLL